MAQGVAFGVSAYAIGVIFFITTFFHAHGEQPWPASRLSGAKKAWIILAGLFWPFTALGICLGRPLRVVFYWLAPCFSACFPCCFGQDEERATYTCQWPIMRRLPPARLQHPSLAAGFNQEDIEFQDLQPSFHVLPQSHGEGHPQADFPASNPSQTPHVLPVQISHPYPAMHAPIAYPEAALQTPFNNSQNPFPEAAAPYQLAGPYQEAHSDSAETLAYPEAAHQNPSCDGQSPSPCPRNRILDWDDGYRRGVTRFHQ
ncbi:uncharacterized protein E0L32_007488 [Thyridium curvatum]|uniref:Uncharacterized protein n=1 Tax=Thyridium curvatum TaxID=1093900 RepID=A0A507B3X5_9PEZI|nr:uncharacterized protein E0L32_007488 [Thyridium curvatum]TPX11751.1 hypothetical protein E0L32_007488 [Thyridium curvatum]